MPAYIAIVEEEAAMIGPAGGVALLFGILVCPAELTAAVEVVEVVLIGLVDVKELAAVLALEILVVVVVMMDDGELAYLC